MTDLFINPAIPRANLVKKETYGYRLHMAQDIKDSVWDAFLARTPGGHHVQTSLWAQVKASLGWQAVRLTVTREGTIVAGAQILLRRLPLMGAVGYVSKGPLLTVEDPLLVDLVINKLQQLARDHRILFLVVQPPDNDKAITQALPWHGFRPSSRKVAPTATIVIDLAQDLDDILAQMHKKTRYGIRRAQREGITVREGSEEDLDSVYDLMLAAAERNQYAAYPRSYFTEIWHLFHPPGYIKLFLAEYQGEVVSAHLAFPFGDTLLSKMGYWSGLHGKLKPNELLEWEVIQWAKTQGYRYYDFEGINIKLAKLLQSGEPLSESVFQTAVSFKLGFSKQVAIFPGAYEYIYHPLLRWGYNKLYLQLSKSKAFKKMIEVLRTQ